MNYVPTLSELEQLMDDVEAETITARQLEYEQAGELASDKLLDAASKLYKALREAVHVATLNGRAAAEKAVDHVVETWERLKDEVGDMAHRLLTLFQEQIWMLISGALSSAAKSLPATLESSWTNDLDSVSAKLAWSVSPSVRVAVDGWLSIAAGGGLDVTATYKRRSA